MSDGASPAFGSLLGVSRQGHRLDQVHSSRGLSTFMRGWSGVGLGQLLQVQWEAAWTAGLPFLGLNVLSCQGWQLPRPHVAYLLLAGQPALSALCAKLSSLVHRQLGSVCTSLCTISDAQAACQLCTSTFRATC